MTSQSPNRSRVDSSSSGFYIETIVLNTLGNKEKRNEADKLIKWPTNEVRNDYVEKLKKSLKNLINPNLFDLMFTIQFKKNLQAVNALIDGLKSEYSMILDLLDLFCKWVTMKMVDQSNTAMTKALLEFLTEFFKKMDQTSYKMYDFEAASILPILSEKISTPFKSPI